MGNPVVHFEIGCRDLEKTGLDRLDLVAHLGRLQDDRRVRRGGDLHLALAGADRLDQDKVEPRRVENCGDGRRGRGQAAGMPPGGHRADEDVTIVSVRLHPDAVAEQRPPR